MKNNKERLLWFTAIGVSLAWSVAPYFLAWRPYSDVEIVKIEANPEGVHFVADFVKRECVFDKFFAFGLIGDIPVNLYYEDVAPQFTDQDRPVGVQRLDIQVFTESVDYDAYEFRTRHICDGEKVDRIFAVVDAP